MDLFFSQFEELHVASPFFISILNLSSFRKCCLPHPSTPHTDAFTLVRVYPDVPPRIASCPTPLMVMLPAAWAPQEGRRFPERQQPLDLAFGQSPLGAVLQPVAWQELGRVRDGEAGGSMVLGPLPTLPGSSGAPVHQTGMPAPHLDLGNSLDPAHSGVPDVFFPTLPEGAPGKEPGPVRASRMFAGHVPKVLRNDPSTPWPGRLRAAASWVAATLRACAQR